MTVGVYGFVAGIVKLDDVGLWLSGKTRRSMARAVGAGIVRSAPWLMRGLSVAGTVAMFLVGGGILTHGVPALHHGIEAAAIAASHWPLGGLWQALAPALLNALAGIVAGGVVLAGVTLLKRLHGRTAAH
jgi:predicted DNA repair protein MutK